MMRMTKTIIVIINLIYNNLFNIDIYKSEKLFCELDIKHPHLLTMYKNGSERNKMNE